MKLLSHDFSTLVFTRSFTISRRVAMRKNLYLFSIIFVFSILIANPVSAITFGELDWEEHPHVVLLLLEVGGEPASRCSGTLLSPTVVLTAGHCTSNYPRDPYTGIRVFTESDVENGDNNYPFAGGNNTIEAIYWEAHPLYETADYFLNDVGVVILAEPYYLAEYGVLPGVDQLDALKKRRGTEDLTFTSVGYGLQWIRPNYEEGVRIRMVAHPRLVQINAPGLTGDYSMLLSNNFSTGGTCYGDSGGPNFLHDGNVIAGVTSWGLNNYCVGTGGVFRMDRQNVQDFILPFLSTP